MTEQIFNKDDSNDTETFEHKDELTLLKERADLMGIKYHPSIGLDKLKEKVNDSLQPKRVAVEKTDTQKKMEQIQSANRLIRIRITCMDPNRKGWKGDFFTVMNSTFGTIKKYVPYNKEWHVPAVILKQIKRKKRQEFYEVPTKNGMKVKRARMVPMYAVEELPPLSSEEIKELARKQALNHSIDED